MMINEQYFFFLVDMHSKGNLFFSPSLFFLFVLGLCVWLSFSSLTGDLSGFFFIFKRNKKLVQEIGKHKLRWFNSIILNVHFKEIDMIWCRFWREVFTKNEKIKKKNEKRMSIFVFYISRNSWGAWVINNIKSRATIINFKMLNVLWRNSMRKINFFSLLLHWPWKKKCFWHATDWNGNEMRQKQNSDLFYFFATKSN